MRHLTKHEERVMGGVHRQPCRVWLDIGLPLEIKMSRRAKDGLAYHACNWWTVLDIRVSSTPSWQQKLTEPESRCPSFFAVVTAAECSLLYLCPFFQNFVFFIKDMKIVLEKILVTEYIMIPTEFVFIRLEYSQHSGYKGGDQHWLGYHMYLKRQSV